MHWILSPLTSITAKDIVVLLLGVSLTFVIQYLPSYLANYRKVTPILGRWHAYHWSRIEGKARFIYTEFVVKRRLRGLRLEIRTPDVGSTIYRGTVSFEGNDVIVDAEARLDDESFVLRLCNPITHKLGETTMVGMSLGVDFDRNKFATIQLCAQTYLDTEAAKQKLSQISKLVPEESALRLS
jgi:hypothetical protein